MTFDQVTENARLVLERNWTGVYTAPSLHRGKYSGQWYWDSVYHTIAERHLFEIGRAEMELTSLLDTQHENGFIPHTRLNTGPRAVPRILISKFGKSKVTQPPVLPAGILRVYETGNNGEFLRNSFERLEKHFEWLRSREDKSDLYVLRSPMESGEDESQKWDGHMLVGRKANSRVARAIDNFVVFAPDLIPKPSLGIRDVNFNSIYIGSMRDMAKIAAILGHRQKEEHYTREAERVSDAMKEHMMQDGFFYSIDRKDRKIKVKTSSLFMPLYARILDKQKAGNLVDYLVDGPFWKGSREIRYPLPTVSPDEESFNPDGYWRGTIMMPIVWHVHQGLLYYGFTSVARELLEKTHELFERNPGPYGFNECYNPITGKGVRQPYMSWSTLIVDMVKSLENQH